MADQDRRSYDVNTSQQVQGDIQGIVARLESLITRRDGEVKAAMADFQADGVSDQYSEKERRWNAAADEVRSIINLIKTTLEQNDNTAQATLAKAKSHVDSI